MPDPITYSAIAPRHGLPLLFAGQAQKEFTVNQALGQIDLLLHPHVQGESATPPASPADEECWLVASGAAGSWADRDGSIACWRDQGWIFAAPVPGMHVYDTQAGQFAWYHAGGWSRAIAPAAPVQGSVVDSELRVAFGDLVDQLMNCGILS
ncbi:MAG: DUF2793 domain-containing protein [Sphingomonadaceae bacterium]